jgi:YidC/Oxa1 family membrane protein insertase
MIKILEKNNSNSFPAPLGGRVSPNATGGGKRLEFIVLLLIFIGLNYLLFQWLSPSDKPAPATIPAPELTAKPIPLPSREIRSDNMKFDNAGNRISNIRLIKYDDIALLTKPGEFIEFGTSGIAAGAEATLTISENYIITAEYTVINKTGSPATVAPYARITRAESERDNFMFLTSNGALANVNGQIKRESYSDLKDNGVVFDAGYNSFAGFEDQYWQTIVHLGDSHAGNRTLRMKKISDTRFQTDISGAEKIIPANGSAKFEIQIYAGPKSQDILNLANKNIPGLAQTIDYGWFSFLSRPFLWSLTELNKVTGNYGLAIIFLTIILRIIMIPLTRKSYKSMAAMQKLQPEMQRIQKLYKDDKMRLQQEMMALYSKAKTNPMSGCLPMLLQIPIFFALYKALIIAVDMRNSDFLWIKDLAAADPTNVLNLFGLIPWTPPEILPAIGILPILMGASMWIQMHLSSSASASMPGMGIMKWMPVIFVVLFAGLPAGLVLYWTVSNIFGLAQQRYILKTMK